MRSLVATCKSSDNIYHIMTLNIQIITGMCRLNKHINKSKQFCMILLENALKYKYIQVYNLLVNNSSY